MIHSFYFAFFGGAVLCCCLNSCTSPAVTPSPGVKALLEPWPGPHGGVPPFEVVRVDDFLPAVEEAIASKRTEIDQIAGQADPPTFENTLEALEKAGAALRRVQAVYYVWTSNMASPAMDSVQAVIEPRLAAFQDSVIQNSALFQRIERVYLEKDQLQLNPEQQRLLWRYYTNFTLAGARLSEEAKAKVAAINQQLASLFTQFSQHLLADERDKYVVVSDVKDLDGLPENFVQAAAEAAVAKGKAGSWVISNTRSAVEPFLSYCRNRNLREQVWRMFVSRGDNGDANDNNKVIPQILKLRAERAQLLGFPTHAHLKLADKMAKTPEKALALLESVWPFAVSRVGEEVADMQAYADRQGDGIEIEAWDYRYYQEKVRKQKYDLDETEIKDYLQLDKLREGMFYVAGELFGLEFKLASGIPVFHPDVSVYEVSRKGSGEFAGLWYFDPYAREGKRSGAWMTAYREQETLSGAVPTLVSNNCNFLKGKPGEPVLVSWDDAVTLFHEFGHALHGLCSNVRYPSLSGTSVATDYVEFPSQVLERWLSTPEVLKRYALHHQTGESMPASLLEKIRKAATFNQGFATLEYLASAVIDMKLHLAGAADIDPARFEKEVLGALGMPKQIVMRHRTPQFGHLFSDDQYSAGYYSYLWSDVLSSDAWEAFIEGGGAYDKQTGKRLHDYVFSVGGTIEESEAYRAFRKKDPDQQALMRERGFVH